MQYVVNTGYVYKDKQGAHKEGAVVEVSEENYQLNSWKLTPYEAPKGECDGTEEKTSGEEEAEADVEGEYAHLDEGEEV